MLVELGVVHRYAAVRELLDHGTSVTDVTRRNGVSHQALHEWLRKYANHGLAGLVDRSPNLRAVRTRWPRWSRRIVELRREHPGWGPRTLEHRREEDRFVARCLAALEAGTT